MTKMKNLDNMTIKQMEKHLRLHWYNQKLKRTKTEKLELNKRILISDKIIRIEKFIERLNIVLRILYSRLK